MEVPNKAHMSMLEVLDRFLNKKSPAQVTLFSFILMALVGIADHLTGYELSFSIFYLVPIVLVTWYAEVWAAFFICCFSAVVWFVVEYIAYYRYSNDLIIVWNAIVRFGFFVTTMLLLNKLKIFLKHQQTLATTDGLTGLLNARAFKEFCQTLLQLAIRHNHPVAFGYIDLDNFKGVNDSLGHPEGDRVLQTVANTLTRCVRGSDVVGRLGGDEFAVLLPETDCRGAKELFSRMHEKLIQSAAVGAWPIGFSIGVAVFSSPPADIDELLEIGDQLMYAVKKSGKNKVIYKEYPAEKPPLEKSVV